MEFLRRDEIVVRSLNGEPWATNGWSRLGAVTGARARELRLAFIQSRPTELPETIAPFARKRLHRAMSDLPIVVTNTCADNCAREFGFGGREQARAWLAILIRDQGRITNQLPAPVERRLLVILGLAERRTLIQRVVRWIRSRRGPA